MLSILEFLSSLGRGGINLAAEGDALRLDASPGVLTPALLAQIEERKAEILTFLTRASGHDRPILPVPREKPLPLSYAQDRLWFLDQLHPGGVGYNITMALRLQGELNVMALGRSLSGIVRRHEVLRTIFATVDDQPSQVVVPEMGLKLRVVDLGDLTESEREDEVGRLAEQEAMTPFDLSRDLMLRATLVRLGGREHVLLLTMHHIASDGWSMGVFWRELAALYGAQSPEVLWY